LKVYNYNPTTKEFTGEGLADKSQLEKDVYFKPDYSTYVPPPDVIEKQKACYDVESESWLVKPDFRGQLYFDINTRQPVIVDFIGDIPENLVEILPELPKTLEDLKAKKILELQQDIKIDDYSIPIAWAQDSINAHYLLNNNILAEIAISGTNLVFNKTLINQLMPIYSAKVIERKQKTVLAQNAETVEELESIVID
jgi:hypothetical protein